MTDTAVSFCGKKVKNLSAKRTLNSHLAGMWLNIIPFNVVAFDSVPGLSHSYLCNETHSLMSSLLMQPLTRIQIGYVRSRIFLYFSERLSLSLKPCCFIYNGGHFTHTCARCCFVFQSSLP